MTVARMTQHVVMTVARMTLRDYAARGLFVYDERIYCAEDVVEDDFFFSGEIFLKGAAQEAHGSQLFFF